MSQFVIVTYPLAGHVTATEPIIKKLVGRGHDIVWITGRMFRDKAKSIGVQYRPLPKEIDFEDKQIYDFFPKLKKLKGLAQSNYYFKHVFLDTTLPTIKAIDSALQNYTPDVLIGDSVTPGVFVKSEISGIPSVMLSTFPLGIISKDTAPFGLGMAPGKSRAKQYFYRLLNLAIHNLLLRSVNNYANDLLKQFNLAPFRKPVCRAYFEMSSIKSILQMSTPSFEYPQSDLPATYQFIGPVLPSPRPDYQAPSWWSELNGSKPVVLITQGTVSNNYNDIIFPAVEGLKREDMLIIIAPIEDGVLKQIPDNVRTEPFIPFGNLMPHIDAIITNGGNGATQLALSNAVPLVIAGATEEKMEVGARVKWSGCGINLRKKSPSPEEFLSSVNEVLTNKVYLKNAKRLQAEIQQYDAPTNAVKIIEKIAIRKIDRAA